MEIDRRVTEEAERMTERTAPAAGIGANGRARLVEWANPAESLHAAKTMSGLDFLQAMVDGTIPQAPMADVLRTALIEVAPGIATFETQPDESLYNPIGIVHGGLMCTLLDSAMGCAVHTTLPAGTLFTSIDINVQYLRSVHASTGAIRTTGIVEKSGRRVTFAKGTVKDREGNLLATATSSLLIVAPDRGADIRE
jgi:uncharacterized protein (TIGR00369 family)